MGKGTGQIYMDYQAMRQKADRLDELAEELLSIAESEVGGCISARNAWQGDSGDVFREKATKLEKKIVKRAKELRRTASALRATAERNTEWKWHLPHWFGVEDKGSEEKKIFSGSDGNGDGSGWFDRM